ncbi:MAG: type II secretion system F family protein [Anaerolineales bacterium]
MDIISIAILSATIFVLIGIFFIIYSTSFFGAHQISQRIEKYVIEERTESRPRGVGIRNANFSDSILQRIVMPGINSVLSILGRYTPASSINEVNRQLTLAGFTTLRAQQYYGIRFLFILVGVGLAMLMYRSAPDSKTLLNAALVVVVTFIIPILWLRMRVAKRQDTIRKSMADALDMLSVSTGAGLGFDQALQKVSQFFKTPAGFEFGRVVSEMEVGVSRQQALRNFADRVQISEVSSFVAVIIQSEILGMSIADVLHAQAEQMRIQRQYRAKEEAQRLPVKMMIPLALLILPALLAVLLGPTIPAILEIF